MLKQLFTSVNALIIMLTFMASLSAADIEGVGDESSAAKLAAFASNPTYLDACGECHLAYPAEMLPRASWRLVMAGLEDHFGDNAQMDGATQADIQRFLDAHSLETASGLIIDDWRATIPIETVLRITALPGFLTDHKDGFERLGDTAREEGFFSPCDQCHKEAAQGVFAKRQIFRGYRHGFRRFSGEVVQ